MADTRKAWAMVLVAVLTYVYGAFTNGMTATEWVITLSTLVGALATYVFTNMETGIGRFAKAIAAFLMPALGTLAVVILDGLTPQEVIEVILTGAAAVGLVAGVPNPGYRFGRKLPTVAEHVQRGVID